MTANTTRTTAAGLGAAAAADPMDPRPSSPVRQLQQRTVAALVAVLQMELPTATWDVCDLIPECLRGQIGSHCGSETDRVAQLTQWARYLDAPLRWRPYATSPGGSLRAEGLVPGMRGVRMEVWTWLPSAPASLAQSSTADKDSPRPECQCHGHLGATTAADSGDEMGGERP